MLLAIDTHVHIYPEYDSALLFSSAWSKLSYSGAKPVLLLTERFDCTFFKSAVESGKGIGTGFEIKNRGANSFEIKGPSGIEIVILAGRQIVTAERLEVLALLADVSIKDGLPIESAIKAIADSGAFPVLPWSPGKWFSKRGAVIEKLIEKFTPGQIAFSDSALRPIGWRLPHLLQSARDSGFCILAGSDPLPLRGQEEVAGSYFSRVELSDLSPASSPQQIEEGIGAVLKSPDSGRNEIFLTSGRRVGPLTLASRLIRMKAAK